jgi:hypothetical protein
VAQKLLLIPFSVNIAVPKLSLKNARIFNMAAFRVAELAQTPVSPHTLNSIPHLIRDEEVNVENSFISEEGVYF